MTHSSIPPPVMPGLVPGIHLGRLGRGAVDGRDKPGHDDRGFALPADTFMAGV